MQDIQQLLSQRQDIESIIGFGLADRNLRNNNNYWLTTLQNKFGGVSFLKTYTNDPNINWFYMYQKFVQQELSIHGSNDYEQIGPEEKITLEDGTQQLVEKTFTTFILPFPTIYVFLHYDMIKVGLLTLDGRIYFTIHFDINEGRRFEELTYSNDDGEIDQYLPFKVQKVVSNNDCLYLLTEDYELYVLYITDSEFYDLRKLDIDFQITNIEGNNRYYCGVQGNIPNRFATIRGVYIDEIDSMQYNIEYYNNVTDIKQILFADDGLLILDVQGRLYNTLNNDYGQVGHSVANGINCLNYKFKVKKMYTAGYLTFLQNMNDDVYKLGGSKFYYPRKIAQPYHIRNIIGNEYNYIMYSKFDDFIFKSNVPDNENSDKPNPQFGYKVRGNEYEKDIALVSLGGVSLKMDSDTRDHTYDLFCTPSFSTDSVNTMVLTYGVIEEDDYFLNANKEYIFEEKDNYTPNYVMKIINGRKYLYTRLDNDNNGDLFRILIKE